MQKKSIAIVAGLFGALALGLFANTQSAQAFWPWPKNPEPPRPRIQVAGQALRQHERMETIWENCDYDAWKERMGDRPVTDKVNADNFGEFCEMHRLMLDGKLGEANGVRKGLDLPAPRRLGQPGRPGCPWHR